MSVTYHKAYLDRTVFVPFQIRTPGDDGFRMAPGAERDMRSFCHAWWSFLKVDPELLPRDLEGATAENIIRFRRSDERAKALASFCEVEVFKRQYHPALGDMYAFLCTVLNGTVSSADFNAIMGVPSIETAVSSAEAIAVAVDCLPVGKDIRNRLQAHVRAHIELLRRIGGDPA